MSNLALPSKQGQICKILNPMPDENPAESYIVIDDISASAENIMVYVVSITDLQRNASNPVLTPRKLIKKSELFVIAQDLKAYVESWNEK